MALDATTAAHFVPPSIIKSDAGAELEIEWTNACMVRLRGLIDPLLLQAATGFLARILRISANTSAAGTTLPAFISSKKLREAQPESLALPAAVPAPSV
jgi:hypothetical protein